MASLRSEVAADPGEAAHVGLLTHSAAARYPKTPRNQGDATPVVSLGQKLGNARIERLLSVDGAATYLGVSRRAIWRLLSSGTLTRVALPVTRRVLIDREDLANLIEESKVATQAPPVVLQGLTATKRAQGKTVSTVSTNR